MKIRRSWMAGVVGLACAVWTGLVSSAAYQQVAWLQASGNGNDAKQLIILDYVPKCTDKVEMKVEITDPSKTQTLWCSRKSGNPADTFSAFYIQDSKKFRFDRYNDTKCVSDVVEANTPYEIVADYNTREVYVNDVKASPDMVAGNYNPPGKLTLFACHSAGGGVSVSSSFNNASCFKFYAFRITDVDGNVQLDLVPARDTTKTAGAADECGVLDRVSGTFYPNLKKGAFKKGDDVFVEGMPRLEDTDCKMTSSDEGYAVSGILNDAAAFTGYILRTYAGEERAVLSETMTEEGASFTYAVDSAYIGEKVYLVSCVASNDVGVVEVPVGKIAGGYPPGYVTWIASPESDHLASTDANWSTGEAPKTGDKVCFDGDYSSEDCTWDYPVADGLGEWMQTARYTGKVTVETLYEGEGPFTELKVAGDMTVEGGSLSHRANETIQYYRLCLNVTGNLTVGAEAKIDARSCGLATGKTLEGRVIGLHAGGRGKTVRPVYGDVYHPVDLGVGGVGRPGGGAIRLIVGGKLTLDGIIRADVDENVNYWGTCQTGGGGSVWITAGEVEGETGSISVAAPKANGGEFDTPSGGRIAVEVTQSDEIKIDPKKFLARGTLARGLKSTGAGTVLVKTRNQTYGTLYVNNLTRGSYNGEGAICWIMLPHIGGATLIPANTTWTFDAIVFSASGVLAIPAGTKLVLPNGFASISGNSYTSGILYLGGEIDAGDENPHVLQGGQWVFSAETPYTFRHSVVVRDGAALGLLRLYSTVGDYRSSTITVEGDLDVQKGSYLYARGSGLNHLPSPAQSRYGGAYSHAGMPALYGTDATKTYGSILNPVLPGAVGMINDTAAQLLGGGALALTVTGKLNIDGMAIATGAMDKGNYYPSGSGGSLNLTAATISGTGIIASDGHSPSAQRNSSVTLANLNGSGCFAGGGGGRVAIRLTQKDAVFPSTFERISAWGGVFTEYPSTVSEDGQNTMASAGTLYLQDGSQAEGTGRIIVDNGNRSNNFKGWTPIPALNNGDAAADLKEASLWVTNAARVTFPIDLKLAALDVASGCRLHLGTDRTQRVMVKQAWVGGNKLPYGTYTAASEGMEDYLEGEGSLVVTPNKFVIIIR